MSRTDALLGACASALVACTPAPKATDAQAYPVPALSAQGEPVAVIGPVTLTTGELEERIQAQTPFVRMQMQDRKRMLEYVKSEVQLEVLAQEAWRRGLQNDPQMIQQFKRILAERVVQDEMKRLSDGIRVTEGDALKDYEARKREFVKPPTIRLAQIVRYVETEEERKAADKLLRRTREKVLEQERKSNYRAFANEAKKLSQDETTKNAGGDLQFLTRDDLVDRYGEEVAKHMFDVVKVGDLAVANAPNAVVLFKKTGLRRGVDRTFAQVKSQIRGRLIQQRRNAAFKDFVEQLKKEQGVEVHLDRVKDIKLMPTGITEEPNK